MSNPAHGASSNEGSGAPVYSCPMHPQVIEHGPSRCPKCGMELEPNTGIFPSIERLEPGPGVPRALALCGVVAVASVFLWQEHQAHFVGALPYILLLLCPLMYLFVRGHGDGGRSDSESHR